MMENSLIGQLKSVLGDIAPDLDLATVSAEADLRNDIGLDSMDFLNFVIGIRKALGVTIPESDYSKVASLAKCSHYIEAQRLRPPG